MLRTLMEGLIHCRVAESKSAYRRALTLCGGGSSLPRQGVRRNLPVAALMQLRDGSTHMLASRGVEFTPDFLEMLAGALLSVRSGATTLHGPLRNWITDVMSCRYPLDVRPITPCDLESHSWPVRAWAVALMASSPASATEAAVLEQVGVLESELSRQLEVFASCLDPVALQLSLALAAVESGQAYNYLADHLHARNRQQVGTQFNCLLPLLSRDAGPDWHAIRLAIDAGGSSVDAVACHLGVQPSAVRALRSAPAGWFAGQAQPSVLVRLVDLLRPEARPRSQDDWRRMADVIRQAEEKFGPAHASFLTRAMVRFSLHGARRPIEGEEDLLGASTSLEELRHAVLVSIRPQCAVAEASAVGAGAALVAEVVLGHSVDRWLFTRFAGRSTLLKLAGQWREACSRAQATDSAALAFAANAHRYWGLIAGEFHAGELVIRPVLGTEELRQIGLSQDLCFGSSHFDAYDRACRQGKSYMLVLRERATGRFRSAARVRLQVQSGLIAVVVAEHFGPANSDAGRDAGRALQELVLHAGRPEVQQHLELGHKLQRARRTFRGRELAGAVKSETHRKALASLLEPAALGHARTFVDQAIGETVARLRGVRFACADTGSPG